MPVPGFGFSSRFSASRLGRGMFRGSGRMSVEYRWLPGWEKATLEASRPSARQLIPRIHDAMVQAMASVSRRRAGGGTEETDDGWVVGVGSPPNTHTHWHLLEFGGGYHFARAPVRNMLARIGKFAEASK